MKRISKLVALLVMLTASAMVFAQETTGSLTGTVKDATGAVIPGATVTVTTPTLVGRKSIQTDDKGYYHFSNLPPGSYTETVEMKGFTTRKQTGLIIEVGHAPTIDLTLAVGSESTVVDVTSAAPQIDVTTVTTLTNVTQDVINFVPRGTSFQSVIQFAPSARNEPLMGNTTTNGSGSVSPGNGSNGQSFGYSIAGGADSENSYLVEGQETANLIGGYSHTNVPFDFIQEVEVKSSGIGAEYGGALGGVINVIMKKGSNHYHGSVFAIFSDHAMDSGPNEQPRYNPATAPTSAPTWVSSSLPTDCVNFTGYCGVTDAQYQSYQPKQDKYSTVQPGFTLGGPLLPFSARFADKLFFFVGFNPELQRDSRAVNYGPSGYVNPFTGVTNPASGTVPFSQNTNTYYTTARIDAQVSKKIRVFGSWLYQLQKQYGSVLPDPDSLQAYSYADPSGNTGQYNPSTSNAAFVYGHNLGYTAPNITVNTGADWTINSNLVSTTRFGYYFENYHDFGYPTASNGFIDEWEAVGLGGVPGTLTAAFDPNYTAFNASKAIEISQDVALYKSTKFGIHNFKFGYQMNRNSNTINQSANEPYVQLFPGTTSIYDPGTLYGQSTGCPAVTAADGTPTDANGGCTGQDGYLLLYDSGTFGHATAYDNGFYGQDSWNAGRGVTINAGIRAEKEFLPGEAVGAGAPAKPINFGWSQKIAPRLGVAWDVFRNGKMKVFGGYGAFYDQMKLNLAISSFGGQYWDNCAYALTDANYQHADPTYNSASPHRFCPSNGGDSAQGNFQGGTTASDLQFIENLNNRAFPTTCSTCSAIQEGVAPNLRPYKQHEALGGIDYQLSKTYALEVRYDRRRLDAVIEDAAIDNPAVGETFVVVNPGQGVNATFSNFCNFLYGYGAAGCASTGVFPNNHNPAAARSYDGVELRLSKAISNNWYGLFSYTYSHFRGNYTGLTSSDLSDGGNGGRNSPNNSRAFDEPYFQYNANGGSSSGLLPTDRPNTLKVDAYYQFKYFHGMTTNLGLFQYFYEGSPNTSYADVGYSVDAFPVKLFDWGKWANITQNQNTGAIAVGTPYTYRNPWYNETDFSFEQGYKISESKAVNFQATFTNLLNDHAVTAIYSQIDSSYYGNQFITPGGYPYYYGIPFYAAATAPYNVSNSLNGVNIGGAPSNNVGGPETINSQYGKPLYYQHPRTLRLQATFTF